MRIKIEDVLSREFPELSVDVPSLPGNGDIQEEELRNALEAIKKQGLVQDAIKLLSQGKMLRSSIAYQIIFPDQKRELDFRVDWIQGPMVYVGYILSKNHLGNGVTQARLYGMNLR